MIGTSMMTKGGIATVVQAYEDSGFFEHFNIRYLPTHTDGSILYKVFFAALSALRYFFLLFKTKYTIIHIHGASRGSFFRKSIFIILARLFNKKTVFHLHGAEFHLFYEEESSLAAKKYIKHVLNYCDAFIVLSSQWRVFMSTLVPENKVYVIHNTLPIAPNTKARKLSQDNCILFLGRVGERKGIMDLLNACKLLEKKMTFKVIIAGDGEVEKYKQQAELMQLSTKVSFVGWIDAETKNKLLGLADVLTLPSYNEGLPMSILEALTHGIPVVSTDVGGIPDVLENNKNGVLIEAGNVDALACGLEKVLSEPSKYTEMSEYALVNMQENFSMEQTKHKLDVIYKALIPAQPK